MAESSCFYSPEEEEELFAELDELGSADFEPATYQVIAHAIGPNGEAISSKTLSVHADPQSAIDEAKKIVAGLPALSSPSGEVACIRVCVETVIKQDGEDADCGALFDEAVSLAGRDR